MSEELQSDTPQTEPEAPVTEAASGPAPETQVPEPAPAAEAPAPEAAPEAPADAPPAQPKADRPPREQRGDRPPREPRGDRPPRDRDKPAQQQGQSNPNKGNDRRGQGNDRPRDPGQRGGGQRDFGGDRRPDMRRPDGPIEIEYDKLIGDSLYLDNQAHVLVARLRDLDAGTRSQLRRLYGAVRRACRAPEADRQHQFVMLRARLAYTIARHGLRSLDPLEKLLLQVTRRNETRGYDRFRDLFEAIIAYNE